MRGKNVAVVLGDNIFYGAGLTTLVQCGLGRDRGATIYGYEVRDASAFGVVTLYDAGRPTQIVEKPKSGDLRLAVPGLYFYDDRVLEIAKRQKLSGRNELEITDINRAYLDLGELYVEQVGRGIAWLDGGTPEDLFEASQLVRVIEQRTGMRVACPEEVALRKRFYDARRLAEIIEAYPHGTYREYLTALLRN